MYLSTQPLCPAECDIRLAKELNLSRYLIIVSKDRADGLMPFLKASLKRSLIEDLSLQGLSAVQIQST